jgi:hypothetical protein
MDSNRHRQAPEGATLPPATVAGAHDIMETVIAKGDLSKLTVEERNRYYSETCESLGLNPLTRPFEYITLNNQLRLYCRRDACDQLRKLHNVSIDGLEQTFEGNMFYVTAKASLPSGRVDQDMGAVSMAQGAGEIRANLMMKAVTKAKRRVTLSIVGLGFLTEDEAEDIVKAEAKIKGKMQTVTAADKPAALPSGDGSPSDPPEEPADGAKPQAPPSAGLSEIESALYEKLTEAANKGGKALQVQWVALHAGKYPKLKALLEEILKPLAAAIDTAIPPDKY